MSWRTLLLAISSGNLCGFEGLFDATTKAMEVETEDGKKWREEKVEWQDDCMAAARV